MNAGRIRQPTLRNGRICPMRGRAVAVLALVIAVSLLPGVRFGAERNVEGNLGFTAFAGLHTVVQAQTDWGQMPLYFIANQGQLDARVAYYVQGRDKTLYFTPEGVTFALTSPTPQPTGFPPRAGEGPGEGSGRWIVQLDFVGANPVRPVGQAQTGAVVSYFKGPRDKWHTGLPTYAQIVYRDLWEGIDLTYSGTVNRLKYEFVVQPGADPTRIRLAYRGASVRLNEAGQLEISTPAGGFQDDAPVAYQEVNGQRVPVAVTFRLLETTDANLQSEIENRKSEIGFRLGAYDPTLPLVIDPVVLVYCGFIGGSGDDYAKDIAVDAAGYAYVTGFTESSEATFPVVQGPDLTYNGNHDVFVAKVRADGTGLVYAGYIGGIGNDRGNAIAVDAAGNAYVAGETYSSHTSFPVTGGPDTTYNGSGDAFVAKVSADGTTLIYCGYIGGNDEDRGYGIAVDSAGNVYVGGVAHSSQATFPVTGGPDLTYNGGWDGFVAKVSADGTGLVYCGYIGGSSYDYAKDIAVDAAGNAYVTGYTYSSEATFPVVQGPDLTYNGGLDVFVAKVKADGTGLVYAGYIGGSGHDSGEGIAVDSAGNAYVTGDTTSSEATFPVIGGPDLTPNGATDTFVAKVSTASFDFKVYLPLVMK